MSYVTISVRYFASALRCTKYDRCKKIYSSVSINFERKNDKSTVFWKDTYTRKPLHTHIYTYTTRTRSRLSEFDEHINDEFESKTPLYAFT